MLMSQTLTYVLLLANRANRKQSVSDLIGYEQKKSSILAIRRDSIPIEFRTACRTISNAWIAACNQL